MSNKQEVIEFLGRLAEGNIFRGSYRSGICLILHAEFPDNRCVDAIPAFFCSDWEEWSGDEDYPVPHPDGEADRGYYVSKDLWTGEYGASRKRFCLYLVEQLKLMSDEDFEKEFCEGATQ